MENWEDQEFKSEWKQAFDGAEATPGNHVWEKIDAHMLVNENVAMKKRVVFYQRLAAASVGVLFLISGYAFFGQSNDTVELANVTSANKTNTETVSGKSEVADSPNATNTKDSHEKNDYLQVDGTEAPKPESKSTIQYVAKSKDATVFENNADSKVSQVTKQQNSVNLNENEVGKVASVNRQEKAIATIIAPQLQTNLPKVAKMNSLTLAYALADATPAVHRKKTSKNLAEQTWAALGFAAGGFSNSPSNLALMQTDSRNSFTDNAGVQAFKGVGQTEKQKMGSSFSFSLAGGKRFSKRWILQGGVSYMNQYSESITQLIETQTAYNSEIKTASFGPENANAVTYSTDSEINSNFQFISLPVQAGYMLVDQKFGVQLNGGLSPDMFLKSTVSDQASGKETVNKTGSNSTFKAVSLSGLGGVELSYRFTEHYRISLVPGFRYSLTPVYKENSLAAAKPFTADIGLRFRYVFN